MIRTTNGCSVAVRAMSGAIAASHLIYSREMRFLLTIGKRLESTLNSSISPIDQPHGDGQHEVREVVRIAAYLRVPHLQSNEAVASAVGRLAESPMGAAWQYMADPSGNWHRRSRADLIRLVHSSLCDPAKAINGTVSLSSDPAQTVPDFYFEYNGFALDRPRFKDRAGFMFFWAPQDRARANTASIVSVVQQLAVSLPISFASADLTLVGNSKHAQQLARRYVGIDVADVSSVALDLSDKIPGVHWLNIYGEAVSPAVRECCRGSGEIAALWQPMELAQGRFALLAKSGLQRGDKKRGEVLADRVALATELAKRNLLHVPVGGVYFDRTPEDSGEDLQQRWHRRYLTQGE